MDFGLAAKMKRDWNDARAENFIHIVKSARFGPMKIHGVRRRNFAHYVLKDMENVGKEGIDMRTGLRMRAGV